MKKIISFDLSSGDGHTKIALKAALEFAKNNKDWKINAFTYEEIDIKKIPENIKIIKCSELIFQNDGIMSVKRKNDSTLVKSINDVVEGRSSVVVSSAASGPLVTAAYLMSKSMFDTKPAFAPIASSLYGDLRIMLDVGANIGANAKEIHNYSKMGSAFAKTLSISKNPIIKQLNIGSEDKKGTVLQQEVFDILTNDKSLNFKGNIEANEILTDKNVNVIVTEAYSGNIALKSYEGAIDLFKGLIKSSMKESLLDKFGFYFTTKFRKKMRIVANSDNIGGAVVLGINHLVIKSHGSSKQKELFNSLMLAKKLVENDLNANIKKTLK